jgi:hypothetical protein
VSLKDETHGKWYNFETGEFGDMLGRLNMMSTTICVLVKSLGVAVLVFLITET